MNIYNSTELLIEYVNGLNFSTIYVDKSITLPISGTLNVRKTDVGDYLINSAIAGNRVAGFFQSMPAISTSHILRGMCIFFTLKMPEKIDMPIFFCSEPQDIIKLVPCAARVSAVSGIPVTVVLAPNALNNYVFEQMPTGTFDWVAPYINQSTAPVSYKIYHDKLIQMYDSICEEIKQEPLAEKSIFGCNGSTFPKFLMPLDIDKQYELFSHLDKIIVSKDSVALLEYLINVIHKKGPEINSTNTDNEIIDIQLCPGCPFVAIFQNNNFEGKIVYTSVECLAVKKSYPVKYLSYAAFRGLNDKKLNINTIFIGALSDMSPIDVNPIDGAVVIALNDTKDKSPLPINKNISKFIVTKNVTFPYSCSNIARNSKIKVKTKNCVCVKDGSKAVCIEKAKCPALVRGNGAVEIDSKLCTGCKICVSLCPNKVLG